MSVTALTQKLADSPEQVSFADVIDTISQHYHYTPASFRNGELYNQAGTNEGSCKIFAFAKLNQLTEAQTLACFGHYYRDDVLKHPDNNDHGNIRNFIKTGWSGISFESEALTAK